MKSKKVYIGIAAITVSLIIVIASIFYIKTNQKDVEISKFEQNLDENTKEAMEETEVSTDEESKEESTEVENKEEEKNEEVQEKSTEKETEKEERESEPERAIEVTEASGTKFVKADSLNVRSGPDTSYSRIGSLKYASEVEITGQSGIWYRISYDDKVGFVRGDYLVDEKPEPIVYEEPSYEYDDEGDDYSNGTEVVGHLIIINSRNNTLRYYQSGSLVASYSCATGTSGTPTPQGRFSIFEKLVNRPYYKENIPGESPRNPLGRRWMQFKSGGYAIHGTNNDSSIGNNASHGCVRMHNEDVIELYSMVPYGTTVIVKNTSASDKSIAAGYGIYIE